MMKPSTCFTWTKFLRTDVLRNILSSKCQFDICFQNFFGVLCHLIYIPKTSLAYFFIWYIFPKLLWNTLSFYIYSQNFFGILSHLIYIPKTSLAYFLILCIFPKLLWHTFSCYIYSQNFFGILSHFKYIPNFFGILSHFLWRIPFIFSSLEIILNYLGQSCSHLLNLIYVMRWWREWLLGLFYFVRFFCLCFFFCACLSGDSNSWLR